MPLNTTPENCIQKYEVIEWQKQVSNKAIENILNNRKYILIYFDRPRLHKDK